MTLPHIYLLGSASTASALASAIEEASVRSARRAPVSICSGLPTTALPPGGLIFLMGVDDAQPTGVNDQAHEQKAMQAMREALHAAGLPYQVLYGSNDRRLAQVMHSLGVADGIPRQEPEKTQRSWTWSCEKCSDPECEHRLLSDLIASREATGGTGSR